MSSVRTIAIYLPQFHPIPENDQWWGKGFTEWTNVTKARPLFKGHYQPHLPSDLGYYDLRLPEVRRAQTELAKENGIYGFCYYHYWFNRRRILERPFQEVFESGKPDFPFMLCWANENWTRRWDGNEKEILLEQSYSEDDDRDHIKQLIKYFKDPRYIRIDNKPVIAIYRTEIIPDVSNTLKVWREEALNSGMELYICRFENFGKFGTDYLRKGFDAAIEFQPFSQIFELFKQHDLNKRLDNSYSKRISLKIYKHLTSAKRYDQFCKQIFNRFDYEKYVTYIIENYKFYSDYVRFPGITPSWDNTARAKANSFLFYNSTPEKYKEWAFFIKENYKPASPEENLLFINAWNEWGEGCHLEPDQNWGKSYLEATKVLSND